MSSVLQSSYEPPVSSRPSFSSDSTSSPLNVAPIPFFSLRQSISGIDTSLLIQSFDDRILVILSQNGKIGCLIQASLPAVVPLPHPPAPTSPARPVNLPPPPDQLLLTPLLGTPPHQTLYHLYASQIATLVWWALQEVGETRRAVVVAITLERRGRRDGATNGEDGNGFVNGDDGEDEGGLGEGERVRFEGVMGMMAAWPGPGLGPDGAI